MDQSRVGDFKRYGKQGGEELNWMYDIFTQRRYSYLERSTRHKFMLLSTFATQKILHKSMVHC